MYALLYPAKGLFRVPVMFVIPIWLLWVLPALVSLQIEEHVFKLDKVSVTDWGLSHFPTIRIDHI